MGMIRLPYTCTMRMKKGDESSDVPVEWQLAKPGAKVFPGIHYFGNPYYPDDIPWSGIGEVPSKGRKYFVPPRVDTSGCNSPKGPLNWYQFGIPNNIKWVSGVGIIGAIGSAETSFSFAATSTDTLCVFGDADVSRTLSVSNESCYLACSGDRDTTRVGVVSAAPILEVFGSGDAPETDVKTGMISVFGAGDVSPSDVVIGGVNCWGSDIT